MHRLLATLIIGLLTIAACDSPDDVTPDPTDTTQTATNNAPVEHTTGARLDESGAAAGPGVSLQTILDQAFARHPQTGELTFLDRLHDPQNVSVETQENIHDPTQIDTLRTLQYDGLELTVYHVSGGKEILKNITVTGDQYETSEGLSVGMTRSKVESLRGQPDQQQNGRYVYNLGGPMPTMLHVAFTDDEVSRIEWQYPID